MRKDESESVVRVFRDELKANLVYVDASERFLSKLAGVADPEAKRKIIGAEFIRVLKKKRVNWTVSNFWDRALFILT